MNLTKLFDTQAALDEHIMQEHSELRGQNNLDWKLLALQVELGECANEWRGFKKWSKDQEPRIYKKETHYVDVPTDNPNWIERKDIGEVRNPLLEEYVDCLHFILSIGLELELNDRSNSLIRELHAGETEINEMFVEVLTHTCDLYWADYHDPENTESSYKNIFSNFVQLGQLLGFTWEQVQEAYYAKNKVNHERQNAGY
ncbi:dUTP diphosphatase [Lysinibacillus sp. CD3-6]|uniref:dUTP diphosphatase n=1 Tax=Lysinibacillus sp. CD3-6 TaxID=2892541 RepID=UPI00116A180D|nr:dUTP diphosphatase [Lysinibacillus sp. CD3-6]UED81061.1 dUTP diphosphatase [Lysinibacillus sp. CD3-6]